MIQHGKSTDVAGTTNEFGGFVTGTTDANGTQELLDFDDDFGFGNGDEATASGGGGEFKEEDLDDLLA
ncbi:hypothetical protein HK100_008482 [Physocladia obscura]|uniref:Uncharacterized protein n=1 Tax=Physocladia obscura TaxID=109957 RepID=A0AAD5XBH9_9FUNG|nr:hypothetical protein HK100_008482 [Physocladia obscura]